mmetsp:Transcript_62133/g.138723  ORF Transcript_62133/g.138723 Transcript_62133/m.138723 type:complete len:215 (-) Transcript_62133:871-1515(-)
MHCWQDRALLKIFPENLYSCTHESTNVKSIATSVQPLCSEAELLDGIFAGVKLCRDNANGCEHSEASVVDFPLAHLLGVLVEADGVAEVARLLVRALSPCSQLQDARDCKKRHEAVASRRGDGGGQSRRHGVKPRELDVVLDHGPKCGHHGHSAVLDLSSTKLLEAFLITYLGETSRVKVVQGRQHADLKARIKRWRWRSLCLCLRPERRGRIK